MSATPRADWATVGTSSALHPLDAAVEYLRERGGRVLPLYLVAMAPFTGAMLFLIDVVTSQDRAALPFGCLLLALATVWRWAWLAAVQCRVQQDLRGETPHALWRRLGKLLVTKLALSVSLLWGAFLLVPAFYGFYLSGIAVPTLLEGDGRAVPELCKALGWIQNAAGRLFKIGLALGVAFQLALLAVFVLQLFLVGTALPSLLGLDVADLSLTLGSYAWTLCVLYFVFVVFDLYWVVASVLVFYDLQSRRLGTDLRLRLLHEAES